MADAFKVLKVENQVNHPHYMASIPLALIRKHYRDWWVPDYQRDRVMQPKKLRELAAVYRERATLDAVKINYRGPTQFNKDGWLELDWEKGHFSIIDGQQRILAGIDSGVDDYVMAVELYFNLSRDREVRLFHQFNRKATRLTQGDLLKSCHGTYALIAKNITKDPTFPVPIRLSSRASISYALYGRLLTDTHRMIFDRRPLTTLPKGQQMFYLFNQVVPQENVEQTIEVSRRIFEAYVDLVGTFESGALAWFGSAFTAFYRVTLHNFLTRKGGVDFGSFTDRVKLTQTIFLNNAYTRQIIRNGSQAGHVQMNRAYIDFLNFKRHVNKIPYPGELTPEQVAALVVPDQAKPVVREQDPWLTE